MKITIISSSTRKGRLGHRVALALQKNITKAGHQALIIDLVELNLPPFEERFGHIADPDGKLEKASNTLMQSDGLIFLTPEYNGAISSGLKNFIDVFAKAPFDGKPIGVATASTGALGGIRAAYQLQQTILSINAYPQPQMLLVGRMDKVLDEGGRIVDDSFEAKMDQFLTAFIGFVQRFV